jgi:hypothetical protein
MTVRTRQLARWYREKLVTQREPLVPTQQNVESPKKTAKQAAKEITPLAG